MTATTQSLRSENSRKNVMLVDGYGLIFRAYHALPPSMTNSRGEQLNAVFGFASMLLDVLLSQKPDYAVIALEGGRTFRHDAFEGYKANRGAMPDDLRAQVDRVLQVADVLNVPVESRDGYEADDVIGSLAAHCSRDEGLKVLIVTGDSDLLQLVDDQVYAVLPGVKRFTDLRLFDRAAVIDRYGFGPELVPDFKALVGDTSDNIPGVPGIGEKTAKALIERFGSIEAMLDQIDDVTPPRARTSLDANRQQALASKNLASIVRDLDITLDRERSEVGNYERDAVIALFRQFEFRTLVAKLPELSPTNASAPATVVDREPSIRTLVSTEADLGRLVKRIEESAAFAFDVETTSTDPMVASLVGIALAVSPTESYYVPIGHSPSDGITQIDAGVVRISLSPVLSSPGFKAYAHHGKYDIAVLQRHGYEPITLAFDTMIAAYLLNETSLRLKDLAFTRLGIEMTEIAELIGTGKNQNTMDNVAPTLAGDYACGDVEATYLLTEVLQQQIEERGLESLIREIELPLVPILIDMERTGVAVDTDYLKALSNEITTRMGELEEEIYRLAGREIKVNSTRQIAALLFDELKLRSGRRTKTGFSVDVDVLEAIRGEHPIVEAILEHRTLGKLKSTYVDALPLQVNPTDGRIHTSFNQTVAATGRLSSTNPNLQNIPIRGELGRRVRHAFVADRRPDYRLFDDSVMLAADYSQIELRLLAHVSNEPFLVEAYQQGEDIHRATAAVVSGVDPSEVTPAMRRIAKTVNFGVLYGMQAFGLSRDSGLSRAEAQEFIDAYWSRLPRVKKFFEETVQFGVREGYVQTANRRRRYIGGLTSSNGSQRLAAERMATNMPLQGGAADIMKMAMIQLSANLRASGLRARMLLQVHDELVLEVDRPDLLPTAELLEKTMTGVAQLAVPLEVEIHAGPNWDDLLPLSNLSDQSN